MLQRSIVLGTLAAGLLAALPACADEASLHRELDALRAEVGALKAEMAQLRGAAASASPSPIAPVSAAPVTALAAQPAPAQSAPPASADNDNATRLWGYGELNYSRPTAKAAAAQADLRRAVLGFSHAFDGATHVYGELEWEHAIVSAEDSGESEVEQLYVEHQLNSAVAVRAGLSLIPLGFINERHEPASYFGVERNFVETAIIPSTWREGGVSLLGTTESGLSWNVGVTTGFDLTRWDAASDEGRASPLASIHQELQLARAHDPSVYGSLSWRGVPGLDIGGGVFTGKIGQGDDAFLAKDARLTLAEMHVRWQPGRFDLSALYARGHISDTEALNLAFVGNPTPVPESLWGGYVQGAWRAWQNEGSSLVPFARWEAFNTAASYAPMPQGLAVPNGDTERVWTLGLNYYLTPQVVFKADYQRFDIADEALGYGNRFNLGVGYQF